MTVQITPYAHFDGIPSFRDSEIIGIYNQMVKEQTASIFVEGDIANAVQFLGAMKANSTFLFVAHEHRDPLMVAWLNRVEHKRANVHFCAFKKIWGIRTVEIGKSLIDHIFELKNNITGEYLIDVIHGVVPSTNRAAIGFVPRCGGKIVGEIPNYIWSHAAEQSESGIMFYYARRC